ECFVFFFQAEDGIRDRNVTGVQTCALPISITQLLTRELTVRADELSRQELRDGAAHLVERLADLRPRAVAIAGITSFRIGYRQRSEERRVGKEGRSRSTPRQANQATYTTCV